MIKNFKEFIKMNEDFVSSGDYIKLDGKLVWELRSKEYEFDETVIGDDWYMARFNNDILGDSILFWSPSNEWMIYCYVWKGHIEWAASGVGDIDFFENDFKNPENVMKTVLGDFEGWLADSATIPELDDSSVYPQVALKNAQKLLNYE